MSVVTRIAGIIEGSEASSYRVTSGSAPTPANYAQTVTAISPLVAYWRFGGDLTDSSGNGHDWTSAGDAVTYDDAGAPNTINQSAVFAGEAYATRAHDADFLLSALTLPFWVRLDAPVTDTNWFFITKDASGLNAGDWGIAFDSEGQLWARSQTGAETAPGVTYAVDVGTWYHVAVVLDSNGLALWVNGRLIGTDATYTGAWSANTQDMRLANPPFNSFYAQFSLDELVIYGKACSEAEILSLAGDAGQAPTAAAINAGNVDESSTLDIDLSAGALWVGDSLSAAIVTKTDLTGNGHDVSVVGTTATVTTGAVSADEDGLEFTYTLTDVNGTSTEATVTINVKNDTGGTAAPIYQLYDDSGFSTTTVTSIADMETQANAASPGTIISVNMTGSTAGGTRTISASGTVDNPIVIQVQGGYGALTVTSPAWTFTGTYVVVKGFYFTNARMITSAASSYIRFTVNRWRQIGGECIKCFGSYVRADRNDVSEYLNTTATPKGFLKMDRLSIISGACHHIQADLNYIHDINHTARANGTSLVGVEGSGGGAGETFSDLIIEYNLITRVELPGESEQFGSKTSGAIVRFNTFKDNPANSTAGDYITCPRQAEAWEFRSNWVEGNARTNGFVQIYSRNSKLIGNRFVDAQTVRISRGDFRWAGSTGAGYPAADNVLVLGNRVANNGALQIGGFWNPLPDGAVLARATNVWANTSDAGGDAHSLVTSGHTGTTFVSDATSYTVPTRAWTSADVGPTGTLTGGE